MTFDILLVPINGSVYFICINNNFMLHIMMHSAYTLVKYIETKKTRTFEKRKVGSYTLRFTHHVLIYYYFIVLSYKVRPYPEPFYFLQKVTILYSINTLTKRKHIFLSFSQFFFTKERKFTTKGKTNAGGLREEFFLGGTFTTWQ
jgi:hypothetical protein